MGLFCDHKGGQFRKIDVLKTWTEPRATHTSSGIPHPQARAGAPRFSRRARLLGFLTPDPLGDFTLYKRRCYLGKEEAER